MKLKELVRGVALDACAVDPELEKSDRSHVVL